MSFSDLLIHGGRRAMRAVGFGHFVEPEVRHFEDHVPIVDNDVSRLVYAHNGRLIFKWDHYLKIYDRHFNRFRGCKVRFLEIGVSHGGSLQLWHKYFGQDATIFGIDIDGRCAVLDDPPSINVRIGSQADTLFLRKTVEEMGGVDIVLDDGSHRVTHQRIAFDTLFPLVSAGGVYMVEDLHTNYWRGEYEGGWRRRSTFIEQMKDAIDDLHGWWHAKAQRLPEAHKIIDSINFYDSIIVVEKKSNDARGPFAKQIGTPLI